MSIELKALDTAVKAPVEGRVGKAFSYIRTFDESAERFNLFHTFPHMEQPDAAESKLPGKFKTLYHDLDDDQKTSWKKVLSDLPGRVGFIPGGSGSGKTQMIMAITALVLAPQAPSDAKSGGPVLIIMEANRLVNDVATRAVQLFQQLGRSDVVVVRGYNVNYESTFATRRFLLGRGDAKTSVRSEFEDWFPTQRADHLPQIFQGHRDDCLAPTFDDLIRQTFYTRVDDFPNLWKLVNDDTDGKHDPEWNQIIKDEWSYLFRRVLSIIDVLVVTVVGGPKVASSCDGAFQPSVVIFDEAARARELSTFAAISYFPSAEAWFFAGSREMSKPYVGSYGNMKLWNPCQDQLRTSLLERAQQVQPDMHWLSLNHQAYGNLEQLPSKLFWDGKIRSGIPEHERFPRHTMHLLDYLQQLASGRKLTIPRMLVHIEDAKPTHSKAVSKFNDDHVDWVVDRVIRDLLQDPDFRSADGKEPGSIVVVTPYRAQLTRYRKRIKDLLRDLDDEFRIAGGQGQKLHREILVQARSMDTVQSLSADVAIVDFVHSVVTKHTNDKNRLSVGLTRAKQAEIIVVHELMVNSDSYSWPGSIVQRLRDDCYDRGQVVLVKKVEDDE
ncbi:hypothetical protein Daus18300_005497 [Diaporthe australafricana]|uniref:DNA2/NAM7 helicase-like C-terminal domain-containing protein n=1 Tax=Diaporthe australafricana TaxID=127596 RepID=A0ABR3X167_9PEZI